MMMLGVSERRQPSPLHAGVELSMIRIPALPRSMTPGAGEPSFGDCLSPASEQAKAAMKKAQR